MVQLGNIAQNEIAGGEGHIDKELRQAVTRAVLEGVITRYGMATGDNSELQSTDASFTKRRRLDQDDGEL